MDYVELIAAKRDGNELSAEQVLALIEGFGTGEVSEAQMGALLMAIQLRGMTDGEIVALTAAFVRSGERIDLSKMPKAKVDRHSTGGVGDKVPLAVAPLVAACGVAVPMVAGRGRSYVGGTLDKIESIPGFNSALDMAGFQRVLAEAGVCISDAPPEIAPADRALAALRRATATEEAVPFIMAGILSKKLAAGIDALAVDVKVGRGSFTDTLEEGRELAEALSKLGAAAGRKVRTVLTNNDQPLGRMVGHALEVREAIEVLKGGGPRDVVDVTLLVATQMLTLTGAREDLARKSLERALAAGKAAQVFERLIEVQGGDAKVVADPNRLPRTDHQVPIKCDSSGFVMGVDAREIGLVVAGLAHARAELDHAVGMEVLVKVGDRVTAGDPVAILHVREPAQADQLKLRVRKAFAIKDATPKPYQLILQ
jgi:pyrimidine-nucleoside phosphorylase